MCAAQEEARPEPVWPLNQPNGDRKASTFSCGGWGEPQPSCESYSSEANTRETRHYLDGRYSTIFTVISTRSVGRSRASRG